MDFNKTINRWHTGCVKYDGLQQNYGRGTHLEIHISHPKRPFAALGG